MRSVKFIPVLAAAALFATLPLAAGDAGAKTSSFMSECSAKWKAAKAAGTVPAGMKWPEFVKTVCTPSTNAGATTTTTAAPSTSTAATSNSSSSGNTKKPKSSVNAPAAPTQNWRSIEVAKTDKNGKPFTQGQIEAHQRIKECAAEWHAAKANNTLPPGEQWPHFWSACNTRLKSQN